MSSSKWPQTKTGQPRLSFVTHPHTNPAKSPPGMHPNVQQHPVIKQPRSGVTWRPLLRGGRRRLPPLRRCNNCNRRGDGDEEDVRGDVFLLCLRRHGHPVLAARRKPSLVERQHGVSWPHSHSSKAFASQSRLTRVALLFLDVQVHPLLLQRRVERRYAQNGAE